MKRVLKESDYICNGKNGNYIIVSDSLIKKGALHDAWGYDSVDACDFCFEDDTFVSLAMEAAGFDKDRFECYYISDTKMGVTALDKKDEAEAKEIEAKMSAWADENYQPTLATWLEYWDGHSRNTAIIECDNLDYSYYEFVDDELEDDILSQSEGLKEEENGAGCWKAESKDYIYYSSCWEDDFTTYRVVKK